MALELNKWADLGTLTKAQVDENWDAIIEAFGDADGLNKATVEQIIGLLAEAIMTPAGVGQALEWAPITYAASLALNGNDFVQGEVTLTGDCELVQPTNFSVGTKYLMVKGNSSTPRTLTFDDAYFKGDLPTLADITDESWHLLSIVAYSASHYVVSSARAL